MSYGDGTITDGNIIRETGISDPSGLFKFLPAASMGKLVLSPHVYPGTLTGLGESSQRPEELFKRLDLSFGLKVQGRDFTSDRLPMGRIAAVLGEVRCWRLGGGVGVGVGVGWLAVPGCVCVLRCACRLLPYNLT
jgi:hypothetical protein